MSAATNEIASTTGPGIFRDVATMTRRNLLRLSRTPQVVVFSTIQPVMFVILFNFVFGGSIDTGVRYICLLYTSPSPRDRG